MDRGRAEGSSDVVDGQSLHRRGRADRSIDLSIGSALHCFTGLRGTDAWRKCLRATAGAARLGRHGATGDVSVFGEIASVPRRKRQIYPHTAREMRLQRPGSAKSRGICALKRTRHQRKPPGHSTSHPILPLTNAITPSGTITTSPQPRPPTPQPPSPPATTSPSPTRSPQPP